MKTNMTMKKPTKESMYMDWINNFLTLETFADHYNITEQKALNIITRGQRTTKKNMKNCKEIYKMSGWVWDYDMLDVSNIDYVYMGMEKRECSEYEKVDELIRPLLAEMIHIN